MMIRFALIATLVATPVLAADSKAESCGYQAEVVAAVQKARLDRVKETGVREAIAATNPTWPANYNEAIPLIAGWVYEKKMRVIRKEDLAAAWNEVCLAN